MISFHVILVNSARSGVKIIVEESLRIENMWISITPRIFVQGHKVGEDDCSLWNEVAIVLNAVSGCVWYT